MEEKQNNNLKKRKKMSRTKELRFYFEGDNKLVLGLVKENIRLQYASAEAGVKEVTSPDNSTLMVWAPENEQGLLKKLSKTAAENPSMPILMISPFTEGDFICAQLEAGVKVHISLQDEISEWTNAITYFLKGESYYSKHTIQCINNYYVKSRKKTGKKKGSKLTSAERKVMYYLVNGFTGPEIADVLFKSVKTINTHRQNIYNKTGIHSISDLILMVRKNKNDFNEDLLHKASKYVKMSVK